MSHRIESHARELAGMLDSGQGQQVAQIMRQDMASMSERDFNKLVQATNRYEKDGCGDDLITTLSKYGNGTSVDVVVNRLDRNGNPFQYADTVREWVKPAQRDYGHRDNSYGCPPHAETANHSQRPWERAGYHSWNNSRDYNYRDNYRDYNYRDYNLQPYRHQGLRPEEVILPLIGMGLTAAFAFGRNNHHHHQFQPRQQFYPQSYNFAPNYYNTANYYHPNQYHQRRYF